MGRRSWQIDPALVELYREGDEDEEVSVILRLNTGEAPSQVRVVARFGAPEAKIVTARCRRGDIHQIHDHPLVFSMKAPRVLWTDDAVDELPRADAGSEAPPDPTAEVADAAAALPEDGSGVMVGIIDYGLDFTHANFRNEDGTTRIVALWDQGGRTDSPPAPWGYGRLHEADQINAALASPDPFATLGYDPSRSDARRTGTHGTHVTDIVAGNRRQPGSRVGIATGSPICFVHLAAERMREPANFGDSVRLLEALDFLRQRAGGGPLVINLSAGMTGGPHDHSPLFAQAVDAMLLERDSIVMSQSTGNYAASMLHTNGYCGPTRKRLLNWLIPRRDRTPNELEIWYPGQDRFDITLIAPSGERFTAERGENVELALGGRGVGTLYHRHLEPNSGKNHVDIILSPRWPGGRTRVEIHGREVVDGRFNAWIERDGGGRRQSRFPRWQANSRYTTNTICNSFRGIAVGAVTEARQPTRFSSRGPSADGRQKPELVAPGYRVRAARSMPAEGWRGEARFTEKSGTSMASPAVAGTLALMLQAAGRPLSIAEIRRLLLGSVDPLAGPARRSTRLGYGYLNVTAAVEAARRAGAEAPARAAALPGPEANEDMVSIPPPALEAVVPETPLPVWSDDHRLPVTPGEVDAAAMAEPGGMAGEASFPPASETEEPYAGLTPAGETRAAEPEAEATPADWPPLQDDATQPGTNADEATIWLGDTAVSAAEDDDEAEEAERLAELYDAMTTFGEEEGAPA